MKDRPLRRMTPQQFRKSLLIGLALLALVPLLFKLIFNPELLHPLLGRSWRAADGAELTSWKPSEHALKCRKHEAYHADGSTCAQ